jgi:TATA-box binding protein (TBP) (component of TFIID and TFIIIB)
MEDIHINNIVATASISDKLDLELIDELVPNSEYNKKRFPGLIYRQKIPKTALLIFSSGKVVCTGAKTLLTYFLNSKFTLIRSQISMFRISLQHLVCTRS